MDPQLDKPELVDAVATAERDRQVLELYDQLIEIEERLIPTGLHVFGQPGTTNDRADMLRMVASFDRPESGARALPNLVAEGLGIDAGDRRVAETVSRSVEEFVVSGSDAATSLLEKEAGVAANLSRARI